MDSIAKAQRRKFMQTNRYAEYFEGLDVAPKGATGQSYYTKGDPQTGAGGNGFCVEIHDDTGIGFIVFALRRVDGNVYHPSLQYRYGLYGRVFVCKGSIGYISNTQNRTRPQIALFYAP